MPGSTKTARASPRIAARLAGVLLSGLLGLAIGYFLLGEAQRPAVGARRADNKISSSSLDGRGMQPGVRRPVRIVRPEDPTYDPRSPEYDAAYIAQQGTGPSRLVFESEPRDAEWADAREQKLAHQLYRIFDALGEDADIAELECRTGSCKLALDMSHPPNDTLPDTGPLAAVPALIQAQAPVGSLEGTSDAKDGRTRVEYYFFFDDEQRDHMVYAGTYGETLAERVAELVKRGWLTPEMAAQLLGEG